jgi:RHS repeat-associated protein
MLITTRTSNRVGIRTCSDYSPFGVELDGRTVSGGYRYGYQGSEKDAELKGNGNSYTTEFRQLDPRIGRWFSIDPVFQPWQSPYSSMDGKPISFNDPYGNKVKLGRYNKENNEHTKFSSKKEFNKARKELKRTINDLKKESNTFNQRYKYLDDQKEIYTVFANNDKGGGEFIKDGINNYINIGLGDMTSIPGCLNDNTFDRTMSIMTTIGHEFGHAWRNAKKYDDVSLITLKFYEPKYFHPGLISIAREQKINSEMAAVHIENIIRAELINGGNNLNLKSNYYGIFPQAQKTKNGKYQAILESSILNNLDLYKEKYLNSDFQLNDIDK